MEDRDTILIFRLIESGMGFGALNNSVMTAIRAWLVDAARAALTGMEGTAGVASMEAAALLHLIGGLYNEQGRHTTRHWRHTGACWRCDVRRWGRSTLHLRLP